MKADEYHAESRSQQTWSSVRGGALLGQDGVNVVRMSPGWHKRIRKPHAAPRDRLGYPAPSTCISRPRSISQFEACKHREHTNTVASWKSATEYKVPVVSPVIPAHSIATPSCIVIRISKTHLTLLEQSAKAQLGPLLLLLLLSSQAQPAHLGIKVGSRVERVLALQAGCLH